MCLLDFTLWDRNQEVDHIHNSVYRSEKLYLSDSELDNIYSLAHMLLHYYTLESRRIVSKDFRVVLCWFDVAETALIFHLQNKSVSVDRHKMILACSLAWLTASLYRYLIDPD